ncbi:MAG: hypothetical protein KTR21_16120 [Rhodobacteraceae bacterium]|nr:hypothetical protein [Paracoccaceae bacterium]
MQPLSPTLDRRSSSETKFRPMIVVENARAASAGFAAVLGSSDAVIVATADELRDQWPDYVVARARTSGAMVVDGGEEGATFLRLAEGRLDGNPAIAGLVAGTLIFLTKSSTSAQTELNLPIAA